MALGFLFSNPFPSLDQAFAGEGGTCHFHGNSPATQEVVIDCATKRKKPCSFSFSGNFIAANFTGK
jgi:hypothetical protein